MRTTFKVLGVTVLLGAAQAGCSNDSPTASELPSFTDNEVLGVPTPAQRAWMRQHSMDLLTYVVEQYEAGGDSAGAASVRAQLQRIADR